MYRGVQARKNIFFQFNICCSPICLLSKMGLLVFYCRSKFDQIRLKYISNIPVVLNSISFKVFIITGTISNFETGKLQKIMIFFLHLRPFSHISFFYTYLYHLRTLLDILTLNLDQTYPKRCFTNVVRVFFEKIFFWPLLVKNAQILTIFA